MPVHDEGYDRSEPNSFGIGMAIFLSGLFLLVVMILSVYYYMGTLTAELNRSESGGQSITLMNQLKHENGELQRLDWVDKSKRQVKVPIETAKALVLHEYKKNR